MIEITQFNKVGGVLTKRIALTDSGSVISDGAACVMSEGSAARTSFRTLSDFAACLSGLAPNQAIALGALRDDLPNQVQIITKAKLLELNGEAGPDLISRSSGQIVYRPGRPALGLIDFDRKGMPGAVRDRIRAAGGFWNALVSVLPEISTTGRVSRTSTSSGLVRSDTGEQLAGSGGVHVYLHVQDGADVERFLRVLHARCWLAGFGWMMVGAGGQLLDRSIVDRMVAAAERLVFESPPILAAPLVQDASERAPIVTQGSVLDTRAVCLDLSEVERARIRDLRADEVRRLAPEAAAERERFIKRQASRIVERTGCTEIAARQVVERQCCGILLPNVELPWDSVEFAGSTVADVLADPDRFDGATLADPLEGPEYGLTKAKIMRRSDGTPWIHSFAHGRTVYELRHDAAAVEGAMQAGNPADAADTLVRLAPLAVLEAHEEQSLRDLACKLADAKARPLAARLKAAREEATQRARQAERDAKGAYAHDRRVRLDAPLSSAERLPVLLAIDDVLSSQTNLEPPMRDADGRPIEPRCRAPIHLYTMTMANGADAQ